MHLLVAVVARYAIVVPLILVVLTILARRRWAVDLADAAASALLTLGFVKLAGALRFEERPFVVQHVVPWIPHAADNAFPSDHLAACGLAFAYLWPRSRGAALVALLFAAAIGAARVIARVHWPIDIFCGFFCGAVAAALIAFLRRRRDRDNAPRRRAAPQSP